MPGFHFGYRVLTHTQMLFFRTQSCPFTNLEPTAIGGECVVFQDPRVPDQRSATRRCLGSDHKAGLGYHDFQGLRRDRKWPSQFSLQPEIDAKRTAFSLSRAWELYRMRNMSDQSEIIFNLFVSFEAFPLSVFFAITRSAEQRNPLKILGGSKDRVLFLGFHLVRFLCAFFVKDIAIVSCNDSNGVMTMAHSGPDFAWAGHSCAPSSRSSEGTAFSIAVSLKGLAAHGSALRHSPELEMGLRTDSF